MKISFWVALAAACAIAQTAASDDGLNSDCGKNQQCAFGASDVEEHTDDADESCALQKTVVRRHEELSKNPPYKNVKPGGKAWLTQKSMDYISHKMLPLLLDALKELKIPEQSGTVTTSVGPIELGFKYKFNNFNIKHVAVQSPQILLSQKGFTLRLYKVQLQGSADYDVQADNSLGIPYSSGALDVEIGDGTTLSALAILGVNLENGKPTVQVSDVHVHAEGTATLRKSILSDLVNALQSAFNTQIMAKISDLLKNKLAGFINDEVGTLLQNLNLVFPIPLDPPLDIASIDCSFLHLLTDSNFAFASVKGDVIDRSGRIETEACTGSCTPPTTMTQAPPPTLIDSMLGASLSEYTVETALKLFQQSGNLVKTFTQEDLPSDFPLHLTTDGLSELLIGTFKLPKMCDAPRRCRGYGCTDPDGYGSTAGNCDMAITASVLPGIAAIMEPGKLEATLPVLFTFDVLSDKTPGKKTFAFSFSSNSKLTASVSVRDGNTLVAQAKSVTLNLKNEKSDLDLTPQVSLFSKPLDVVVNKKVVPLVNTKYLTQGFPLNFNLDMLNISASNAKVMLEHDTTTITSDLALEIDWAALLRKLGA